MRHLSWWTVFWGIVWISVIVYIVQNPASSATTIRGWVTAAYTFVATLVGA